MFGNQVYSAWDRNLLSPKLPSINAAKINVIRSVWKKKNTLRNWLFLTLAHWLLWLHPNLIQQQLDLTINSFHDIIFLTYLLSGIKVDNHLCLAFTFTWTTEEKFACSELDKLNLMLFQARKFIFLTQLKINSGKYYSYTQNTTTKMHFKSP